MAASEPQLLTVSSKSSDSRLRFNGDVDAGAFAGVAFASIVCKNRGARDRQGSPAVRNLTR